jgi:ABC-type Fe3+-siderophore transport system permease subunit
MKTISQILIILLVAALLGGVMYAAVSAGGDMTQMRERGDFDERRPAPLDGQLPPERDGRVILPFGVVKSLVLMSLIGVPYFFWRKRAQRLR